MLSQIQGNKEINSISVEWFDKNLDIRENIWSPTIDKHM